MRARVLFVVVALGLAVVSLGQAVHPSLLSGMKWREIGPWRAGRSNAVSGVPGRPDEFYGGFTGGGVWKSTDAGKNWTCVSDGFFKTGSVGSIAVSPSDPDTVYVGMGEHALRGNVSHGDGVYRSDDGGKTWRHLGLAETRQIGRVRIHPTNPDIAWVAALGPTYGPSAARGVYKTTDGGKTWRKTLFVSEVAGGLELSFAPTSPETLFATTWEAWRTPYSLNSGGPGSRIYRSTDGGETWTDITRSAGLPSGVLGKIGISVSPASPQRVYAMIEAAEGGVYRSEDNGFTWRKMTGSPELRQRPWYYTRIFADPKQADQVYVLNVAYHRSTNGGQSFTGSVARHSDHHDLWIDPNDPQRMVMGNDGGVTVSVDGGRTWTDQDIPTAQFYHVSADNAHPYRILGAQQDNSTVRIASQTFGRGIGSTDWTSTAGGESGYVVAKPDDPDVVLGGSYGGELEVIDHATGISRNINAWPDNPMGAGAEGLTHRFQWTFPIVFSPHDPNVVYTGSQYVLVSRDLGGSWTKISPDLTTNDKSKQKSSGGPITKDNTSVEYYCTVFTIAESPRRKGVIWAGSDDGLIHITENGGRTWRNVTPPSSPKWGLVSMIEASPHDPAVAYVAVDNHENNDYRPYVFVTRDYGRTWSMRAEGIGREDFVRVVREDPAKRGLLFAGTETGVYVSADDGATWSRFTGNLPVVPIHDLVVHRDDLIVATHGRSFWVLDDISPLRQAAQFRADQPQLLNSRPGIAWAGGGGGGRRGAAPADENVGQNPMTGLVLWYYLPAEAKDLEFELVDAAGTVVATAAAPAKGPGLQRVSMTPRYPGPRGFPGMRMWGGAPGTLKAPPGTYTARMKVDGKTLEMRAAWAKDPRVKASDADLVEQWKFSTLVSQRTELANTTVTRIRTLRAKIEPAIANDAELTAAAQPLLRTLQEVEEAIYQTKAQSGQDFLNYPIRLNNKLADLVSHIQGGWAPPTRQSREVYADLNQQLQRELDKLEAGLRNQLPTLNAALRAKGKAEITP